jgi:hypothetical protein
VAWRRKGNLFFDQPGHWLLFVLGVMGLLSMVPTVFIWRFLLSKDGAYSSATFQAYYILLFGTVAANLVVEIYIAWKKCRELRWRMVFVAMAISSLTQLLRPIPIGSILVLIALTIAVVLDRRQRIARDVAHWCGVWLSAAACILGIGSAGITALHMYYMQ